MDKEIWVIVMKKILHLFQIIDEDGQYQYHDHELVHDCKEDQEELHHNVIHLYPHCFSKQTNKKIYN
jgi:hypothetical protein